MARIVHNTASTANGFLTDERDSLAWLFSVTGDAPDMTPFTDTVGVIVMGSHTYEWLLGQGDVLHSPEVWDARFGSKAVYVFTSRVLPTPDGADVRLCSGPVTDHLDALVAAAGDRTIWVQGGGDLAGQFLDVGRLDRITVTYAPAFLAEGKPLLPRTLGAERLRLVASRTVGQFVEVTWDVRPAGPVLRTARADEFGRLVMVWRSAVDATHDFVAPADLDDIEAHLSEYLAPVELVVAEVDGTVVGFAGVAGDSLEMLFVDAGHHGAGIGKILLRHAVEAMGVTRVDVNEQNTGALGFYEHHGFRVASRSDLDGQGRPYPLLHLSRAPLADHYV